MKTFFTLLIFMGFSMVSRAQTISNSDFENWTTTNLFEDPQGLSTTNLQSYFISSTPNVTKSTDSHTGTYAAKLETKIIGTDTIFAMISNGNLMGDIGGGMPYTSRPDTFRFSAKYNVTGGDSAAAFVIFKAQGNFIGMSLYSFQGTSNSYVDFAVPITWILPAPIMPDSMLFIVISSNPDINPINGSWLIVDDIMLDNTPIPGGNFESWIMHSYEEATSWNSFNFISAIAPPPYVTKTTDAYSGTYAMKITTTLFNDNQDTLAHITNGRMQYDDFSGGMATMLNPRKVTGYYKYTPVGFDTALVALRAYGFDNQGVYQNLDNNLIKLAPASSYTYFEINLNYTNWPRIDTLGIAFASSNIYDGQQWAKEGSVLIIDSLNVEYYPVGMAENQPEKQAVVYPNPASNTIHFDLKTPENSLYILVLNIEGQEIINQKLNGNSLNVSALPSGIYFYQIISDKALYKGKFSVKH